MFRFTDAVKRFNHPYLSSGLMAAACIVFAGAGEWAAAAFSACVAGVSWFSVKGILDRERKVDEQKCRLDMQLIQSQKLAAVGELSAGIAHEINNPLAVIWQEVEWVRHLIGPQGGEGAAVSDELRESLLEIGKQVDRCREITHKLLDFARKKEPLLQTVDLNRLIEDMVKLVELEARPKNIRMIRAYVSGPLVVKTDAPLVRQVALNLLNNAMHAVEKDGVVTVWSRMPENGMAAFGVTDTGCGISQGDLGKIFDPFFTTKPQGKGTGLGLSICHGIVSRLGGDISVVSEPGKGATFTVHLPADETQGYGNGKDETA